MPPTGSPTVRRRELGLLLRSLRTASGMSSQQVADWLGVSRWKVSRLETGQRGASQVDIARLCDLFRVDEEQRSRLIDLAEAPVLGDGIHLLRTSLEGRYLLVWSADIEASFLARAFGGRVRKWMSRSIDVLRLAVLADRLEGRDTPERSYTLAECVARAGLPVEEAHDALNDALMTAEMFLVLAARLARFGVHDVRSLARPTRSTAFGHFSSRWRRWCCR